MRPQRTVRGMGHVARKGRRKVYSGSDGATSFRHPEVAFGLQRQTDGMTSTNRCRLTLWTERTTIDGTRFSIRSPNVEKIGRGTTLLAWGFCFLLLSNGRVASAQEHGAHEARGALGTVEFRVACTAEAQESFTRGVALLHSLTYEESAEAFAAPAIEGTHSALRDVARGVRAT